MGWLRRRHLLALLAAGLFAASATAQAPEGAGQTFTYTRDSGDMGVAPAAGFSEGPAGMQAQPKRPAAQGGRPKAYDDEAIDLQISIESPDPARLFQRDSESSWKTRIVEESRRRMGGPRITFPEYQPITRGPFIQREFPPLTELVEPGFVMHRRLYFEQPNMERYGWDLGILSPAISTALFYKDVVLLPYHFWTRPFQHYDTSAGKCLPGDPTPLYLYPPELSLSGLAGEAGVIVAGFFIFP